MTGWSEATLPFSTTDAKKSVGARQTHTTGEAEQSKSVNKSETADTQQCFRRLKRTDTGWILTHLLSVCLLRILDLVCPCTLPSN